jgi:NADH-quinone oxidoreductase subunit L
LAGASIAQIGLIFIEIALGWHMLALLHFAGNAFLRTYQLLVSPSVLSYRIHDMFFNFVPREISKPDSLFKSIQYAVYVLSLKEWNVDFLLYRYLWNPFKWIGRKTGFMDRRWVFATLLVLLALGASGFSLKENLHVDLHKPLTILFSTLALLLVLKAFTARENAEHAWLTALLSQFFSAISLLWNKDIVWYETCLYLGGTMLSAIIGYICLQRIQAEEGDISIQEYHGHSYEHPGIALVFLLACLGFSGFPITPTFIGIDLMFTHISANQIVLVVLTALNFLFLELTILRIYTRVFLGQHKKRYHPVAFKSS